MSADISRVTARTADGKPLVPFDDADLATLAAALRYYQQQGMGDPFNRPDDIHALATNDGAVFSSLDDAGIEQLFERVSIILKEYDHD